MATPFPLIEVSGLPRERGRSYGVQAAERIRKGLAHYGVQLRKFDLGAAELQRLTRSYLPTIDEFDDTYVDEMRGIAEGAGVELEDVVLLNRRTEVLKLAADPARRRQIAQEDGCTAVAVMPGASADCTLIHAQNWDWKAEYADTAVVPHIRRDDGPEILTFTEAGGLARCGLNAAGIAITANYLQSDRDYRTLGVPLAPTRRKALQQAHLAHAMQVVYSTPESAVNNMMVSHCGGVCINFECAPNETFLVQPTDGLLVHASRFVSPVALSKLRDMGMAVFADTLYRDIRVRDLLSQHLGRITVDHVKAALADDIQTPFSVCRPVRKSTDDNLTASAATVVMRPGKGNMEVAPTPAHGLEYTTYALKLDGVVTCAAA